MVSLHPFSLLDYSIPHLLTMSNEQSCAQVSAVDPVQSSHCELSLLHICLDYFTHTLQFAPASQICSVYCGTDGTFGAVAPKSFGKFFLNPDGRPVQSGVCRTFYDPGSSSSHLAVFVCVYFLECCFVFYILAL